MRGLEFRRAGVAKMAGKRERGVKPTCLECLGEKRILVKKVEGDERRGKEEVCIDGRFRVKGQKDVQKLKLRFCAAPRAVLRQGGVVARVGPSKVFVQPCSVQLVRLRQH